MEAEFFTIDDYDFWSCPQCGHLNDPEKEYPNYRAICSCGRLRGTFYSSKKRDHVIQFKDGFYNIVGIFRQEGETEQNIGTNTGIIYFRKDRSPDYTDEDIRNAGWHTIMHSPEQRDKAK